MGKLKQPRNSLLVVAWTLLFAVLGVLGNTIGLSLGFNVTFIFGSVFGLIAVVLLGRTAGVVASLLAASYTIVLWNHPYAIVIFGAEALWLALIWPRRPNSSIFFIDFAYWCLVGVPLVFLFYYVTLKLGLRTSGYIAVKQSLNGVCNAIFASVLLNLLPFRKWVGLTPQPLYSISKVLFEVMAFILVIPSVAGLLYINQLDIKNTEKRIARRVAQTAYEAAWHTSDWLDQHERATQQLAAKAAAANFTYSDELQKEIADIHALFPGFHNVFVADGNATTIAFHPIVNEKGESTLGISFADREWFKRLKETRQPLISDGFMGRGGVFEPIFSISTPVLEDGELVGFGLGAVNLDSVEHYLLEIAERSNVTLTLLDGKQCVIVSTDKSRERLEPFGLEAAAEHEPIVSGVQLSLPRAKENVVAMSAWDGAVLFTVLPIGQTDWTLLAEGPLKPLQQSVYDASIWNLAVIFLLLFATLLVSYFLSRNVSRTLESLAFITSDLPRKIEADQSIAWPRTNTRELYSLTEHFKSTAEVLRGKVKDLKGYSLKLESEVSARTAELQSSNDKFRVVFDNEVYAICIFDLETLHFLEVNQAYERVYGYTREELLSGMTIHDITVEHQTFDAATQQAKTEGTLFIPLRFHKKKSGESFPVEIVGGPYLWSGKTVMFAMAHDISDRVAAENARRESEARWQFALEGSGEGVWDWNVETNEVLYSDQWKVMLGFEAGEIDGTLSEWESRLHPDDEAKCLRDLERHFKGETDVYINEHRLRCKDGSYKWILDRGKVVERTADGKPKRAIGTHFDLTQRKEIEEKLERYAESQRVLLREVNHRVKNNLALIIGMLHMEASNASDGACNRLMNVIEGRIQALSVVHSVLSSTGWRPINLRELCQTIVTNTLPLRRDTTLRVSPSELQVTASQAHNIALLMNELATNSVKHIDPERPLVIDITLGMDGAMVAIDFKDNGPGFPLEVVEGGSEMTGIGIKLIKGLVETSLGGEIKLSNRQGALAEIRFEAETQEAPDHGP